METQYHISVLTETIGSQISARALQMVIAGNLGQDMGWDQFKPHVHFDNSLFSDGLAFMEEQHAIITQSDSANKMWSAFGKLTHAAQDFYSHSNYVDLWLKANGGFEKQNRKTSTDSTKNFSTTRVSCRATFFCGATSFTTFP